MNVMKRIVATGIIFILAFSVFPIKGSNRIMENGVLNNGRTLYVGGTGPNNYTHIQDAINDAENGDTIFVYDDSSPYYENIVIDKSIKLIGENRETTIIDGMKKGDVIRIIHHNVVIKNFTIRNSSEVIWAAAGIFIDNSQSNIISNNVILVNNWGIFLNQSNKNTISDNLIFNELEWPIGTGIQLEESSFNKITRNSILQNEIGIFISLYSKKNIVSYNIVMKNDIGIHIWGGKENIIFYNDLIDNNERNAFFVNWIFLRAGIKPLLSFFNIWLRNYWDNWYSLTPKPIFGVTTIVLGYHIIPSIPWLNFDWMPRLSSYGGER